MASVEVLAGPEWRRRWSIEQKRANTGDGTLAVSWQQARQADHHPPLSVPPKRTPFFETTPEPGDDKPASSQSPIPVEDRRAGQENIQGMRPRKSGGSPDRNGSKRQIVQAAARLLLERDRLGLTGVSAAALLTTSDFDVERVLRLRLGFSSASAEARTVGIAVEAISALALRPRPNSFARADCCSE